MPVQMVLNMSSRDVLVLLGCVCVFLWLHDCVCMSARRMDEGDGGGMERDVADDRR